MNAKQSCIDCPSYMTDAVATKVLGRSTGSPMCKRFGHVLGKPGITPAQQTRVLELKATGCTGHGQPEPATFPFPESMKIALPNPDALSDPHPPGQPKTGSVTTCSQCRWFAKDTSILDEFGWSQSMCVAKGRLLFGNRLVYEARDCEVSEFGRPDFDLAVVNLLPEYTSAFDLAVDPIKAYFAKKADGVEEPGDHETDKDLDADDIKAGIKAWRAVPDPEGTGQTTYLPIFGEAIFDAKELGKVPRTGDDEHPELYVDHNGAIYAVAVSWMELDETPALWGVAGVGKTELFRHLAWLMCLPFERVSITGSSELDDLAGKMHFEGNETKFKYGRVPQAWMKPCVMVFDEPNTGQPDVWQFLRPLTDNSKQLVLDMNEGEPLDRHLSCFMGMAMNPAWDPRNVGTATIGDADGSRLFHIFMDMPPESLEKEIIRNRVKLDGWEITDRQLKMVMDVAADLRHLSENGTLPITWGIRPQIKVARALRWFEPVTAYRRASADMLEPEAMQALLDIVRSHTEVK